jgi:XTP/dITP diphosphohydrolase
MKLVLASNNQHKIDELRALLPSSMNVITMREAGITIDIPEPYATLEENAREKAETIFRLTGLNCFSEDTGLEVEALKGAPGVHSARYAGEERSSTANIHKLLRELEGEENRAARFRTIICLHLDGGVHYFEGICPGRITEAALGEKGFGYDPVFIPEGACRRFSEMTMEEKAQYSHRAKALARLVTFLNNLAPNTQY